MLIHKSHSKNDLIDLINHLDLKITFKELQDDIDYIKQFGDIPSVRRACRLLNIDPKFNGIKIIPLVSPQVQKALDDKKIKGVKIMPILTVRRSTKENPVIVDFD